MSSLQNYELKLSSCPPEDMLELIVKTLGNSIEGAALLYIKAASH